MRVAEDISPSDFRRPGHVSFNCGGVLERNDTQKQLLIY